MITASDIGRNLTADEANIGFFWEGQFEVSERLLIEPYEIEKNYGKFRQDRLVVLNGNPK